MDIEKKRAREREYRKNNPERMKKIRRRTYQKNKEKIALKQKEYREKNKEKISAYRRKHYLKEKDKINEWKKEYYQQNKEKISLEAKKKYKEQEDIRERVRSRAKKWREENPDKYKAYQINNKEKIKNKKREYYLKKKEFVDDYKKDKSCVKCGYNEHTHILQFHHTNKDKEFSVGSAIGNKSNEVIKKEMEKCILLCPNCHFLHHSKK